MWPRVWTHTQILPNEIPPLPGETVVAGRSPSGSPFGWPGAVHCVEIEHQRPFRTPDTTGKKYCTRQDIWETCALSLSLSLRSFGTFERLLWSLVTVWLSMMSGFM